MAAAEPSYVGVVSDDEGMVMTAFFLVSAGFIFLTLVLFT